MELVGGERADADDVAGLDFGDLVSEPNAAVAAQDGYAVLVSVVLERCVSAGGDFEIAGDELGLRLREELPSRNTLVGSREVLVLLDRHARIHEPIALLNHWKTTIALSMSPDFIA